MKKLVLGSLLFLNLNHAMANEIKHNCLPNEFVVLSDGSLSCHVDILFTEDTDGISLITRSFGIVRSAMVQFDLSINPNKLDIYLQEQMIRMPQQRVSFVIETNGTPIDGHFFIQPQIGLKQHDGVFEVEKSSTHIMVTGFDTNLPSWVDSKIERVLNTSGDKSLVDLAEKMVKELN